MDKDITSLAGVLTLASYGRRFQDVLSTEDDLPTDPAIAKEASDAATVFAKITETARAKHGASQQVAMEAYGWALQVARDHEDAKRQLEQAYSSICMAARRNGWTHATKVAWSNDGWTGTTPRRWWPFG